MEIGKYNLEVIKQVSIDGTHAYEVSINNRTSFAVFTSPFGNCQTFGIRHFEYLVGSLNANNEDINKIIKGVKTLCGIYRPLLILDITNEVFKLIKDYVNIYSHTAYKNYNQHAMNLCLIDTVKTKDALASKE